MTSERPSERPNAREQPERGGVRAPFGSFIPLGEAARQLGVSPDAVRMRLGRGTLRGEKRGRQWFVSLSEPHATRTTERTPNARTAERAYRSPFGSVAADTLIAELRADVAYLRDALAREQAAHGELRRMWHTEQQARQLAAPVDTHVDTRAPSPERPATAADGPESSARSTRRWWRVWRS